MKKNLLFFKYKNDEKDFEFHKRMFRMKNRETLEGIDTAGLDRAQRKYDMPVKPSKLYFSINIKELIWRL